MVNEVFSDYFALKNNLLTRIDPRVKIFFVFGAIVTILFSHTPILPVIVAILSLLVLLSVKIPPKIILFKLLAPLTMATIILFIQVFFYDNLFRGLLIVTKVAGCVSLIIFLSMTTSVIDLLKSASWFGISKTWIEIAAISYRYIFVLLEDALTIRDAQRVRLGYSSLPRALRSLGELSGSVFIRAFDQSISTYEAMCLRGYSEHSKISFEESFKLEDGLHLAIFIAILFLLAALNLYWR